MSFSALSILCCPGKRIADNKDVLRRDQRLYRQTVSPEVSAPEPLTPESNLRYADGVVDAPRQRIITVQEDHSGGGEAVNTIAAVCEWPFEPGVIWVIHSSYAARYGCTSAWVGMPFRSMLPGI